MVTNAATILETYLSRDIARTKEVCDKSDLTQMAEYYVDFKERVEEIDEVVKKLKALKEKFAQEWLPELFDISNVTSINLTSGHRVTRSSRIFVSVPADNRDESKTWLRDHDYGDLIAEVVNASSLASLAKQLAEDGEDLPESIFSVTYRDNTSVTKIPAKKG